MRRFLKKGLDNFSSHKEQEEQALQGHTSEEYDSKCRAACPSDVYMISGCMDKQTSADVSNVQSFGLPSGAGPGGAGGACTNALLSQAYKPGEVSWVQLLQDMQAFLKKKGYSQVPQLSSSRKIDLKSPFIIGSDSQGRHKALLIGINYVNHTQGRLSGCINDVVSMKDYITKTEGFREDPSSMKVLIDDRHSSIRVPTEMPTKQNIFRAIDWLVSGAQSGDCLFFHYSGHGGQQKDTSGDEADGMDETLIPEDFRTNGVITDDQLFEHLCASLPPGVRLVCIMDCCHSGTILDLPYTFVGNSSNINNALDGVITSVVPNPQFASVISKLLRMGIDHLSKKYPGAAKMAQFLKM
eukprot:Sspe_Gene.82372::Locus_53988_Transcript_1_1_Confidence_1.000_Length_1485::g.82372::m.82372